MFLKKGCQGFRRLRCIESPGNRILFRASGRIGIISSLIFLAATVIRPAVAGEYHIEEQVCSDCHTIHFSQEGRPPAKAEPGGPFAKLLLASSSTKLCLNCHDGSDVDAPDVLAPISTSYSPDEFSAAGFFEYSGGIESEKGHDLSVPPAQVPLSGMASGALTCTSCHDPHGSKNYRNLKDRPGIGTGTPLTHSNPLLPTDNVFEQVHPDGRNPGSAYRLSNIGYRSEMSAWCAECHDRALPNAPGAQPAHFQRHPTDVTITSGGSFHIDEQHWLLGTGAGFGLATGDGTPGIPRVRFQTSSAVNFEASRLVSTGNEVFCGTCHFAHGSPYSAGATWPFKTTGDAADANAPCQQCHNE